jgi:phage terminase large subunit
MEKISIKSLINPQPKQLDALETLLTPECKYLLYGGAMAGGKSYLLRWGALSYVIYLYLKTGIKGIPIGLFSEDYPTLKDRQVSRIEREFPKWLGEIKDSRTDGLAFVLAEEYGAGKILLRNLDDPAKYMSTEFAAIFVEELTRNDEQTFRDLRNRLRYPGIEEVKFMGATNPGGVGHGWVKKLFVDQVSDDPEQPRFFYVHANAYDNKYISPDYVKQLESLPEQQRKAYLEGSWDVFAGQYFPEWSPLKHTVLSFKPTTGIIIGGMDWGYSNPFSFHLAEVKKLIYKEQQFYRVRPFLECYGTEKTAQEWSSVCIQEMEKFGLTLDNVEWIQADPAMFNKTTDGSISIRDQFVKANAGWRKLKPGSNDRIPGWMNYHQWLSIAPDGLPYYQVALNCKNLVRTLPQLIHDELKVEDVDSDVEDHAPDDQRYMLKGLKWLGVKSGDVSHLPKTKRKQAAMINPRTGKQVSINLGAFETAKEQKKSWWQ